MGQCIKLTNIVSLMKHKNNNLKNKKRKLFELISSQGGYFTARQALKIGYSYRSQKYNLEVGEWIKVGYSSYKLSNYPISEYSELIELCFWSRDKNDEPQAIISHQSALSVHKLGEVISAKVCFTVPKTFRKKIPKNYICYKSTLEKDEIEDKEGFRVTTPIKTIIDVSERIDLEQLEKVVLDAYQKGFINQHVIEKANTLDQTKRRLLNTFSKLKK